MEKANPPLGSSRGILFGEYGGAAATPQRCSRAQCGAIHVAAQDNFTRRIVALRVFGGVHLSS